MVNGMKIVDGMKIRVRDRVGLVRRVITEDERFWVSYMDGCNYPGMPEEGMVDISIVDEVIGYA